MKRMHLLVACFLFVGLFGCIERPQTVREGIAAGYVSIESIADSVAIATRDGYLTEAQCNGVLDRVQSAQNLLVDAQELEAANQQDKAMTALKVAQAILREIEGELKR